MTSIVSPVASVKPPTPVSTHAYCDKVALWLPRPLDKSVIKQLKANAAHVYIGNRVARFDRRLVQRIELKQPKESALRALAGLPGAYVNQVEVALDLVFNRLREQDQAFEVFDWSLVRRWHSDKQQVLIFGAENNPETRYDAGRFSPNQLVVYREHHSRISGESNCLHVEWRLNARRAVVAAGIQSVQDLLRFNHRQFWEKRLLLYEADPERVGAFLRHRKRKGRPEKSDLDHKRGLVVINSVRTIQELLDRYRETGVRRVLRKIEVSSLLQIEVIPLPPTVPGEKGGSDRSITGKGGKR
jgi:hypothetical protein